MPSVSRSAGNDTVIAQFAAHWPAAARPSAAALMRLGNISPSSTHTTGPHDMPNATTNRLAATNATGPATSPSTGFPSTSGAVPKITAIVPSVTAMPVDPTSSSGLRPTLSISAIAINVVRMLMIDVITVMTNDELSVNPTASQSTL